MKLYTNGCSFTHGTNPLPEDEKNHDITYKNFTYCSPWRQRTVWPEKISPLFSVLFNHAMAGTGVDRLVRTTMQFVEHLKSIDDDISDWMFILQVSQPARKEIIHKSGYLSRIHYIDPDQMEGYHAYDLAYDVIHTKQGTPELDAENDRIISEMESMRKDEAYKRGVVNYSLLVENDYELLNRHFKSLLLLVYYLEHNNINYLLTGMDPQCLKLHYSSSGVESLDLMMNLLPYDKILIDMVSIFDPEGKFLNRVGPDDNHPNDKGHELFSRYIITELKKRNYL